VPTPRTSLRRRILIGLIGYVVLLSITVVAFGFIVNERAEELVWKTLLDAELDHLQERMERDPGYRWVDTGNLAFFDGRDSEALPVALRGLAPGVHDELVVEGIERVVLVRTVNDRTVMLALDITDFERSEWKLGITMMSSSLVTIALLAVVIAFSVNRLTRPISDLALQIERLRPDRPEHRIAVSTSASLELAVIADALNEYLQRHERFVERERVFIDTASHELRTPIAVIAGASEIALQDNATPTAVRGQIARIRRTASDVEQLISLLLVLARDPERMARVHDRVALEQLIPEIVEDHRHLSRDKDLDIAILPCASSEVIAPLAIVQAAIGNLLRNAIENSDRGTITIRVEAPATVIIEDPGHGMTPEEISAVYARLARGGAGRGSAGIGLALISRLCEHLGWTLDFASTPGKGTVTRLRFRT